MRRLPALLPGPAPTRRAPLPAVGLALLLALGAERGPLAAEEPAGAPAPAGAAPAPLGVPAGHGLVLDGKPEEPAWSGALTLSADPLDVPPPPPGAQRVRLEPQVRLLHQAGLLWIGLHLDEDPGMGMGLRLLAGPEGLGSAAGAVGVVYAPLELRGPRLSVRSPAGLTRAEVRARAQADTRSSGRWSLELAVPLADLGAVAPAGRLRLALAIDSRTNNVGSAAPAGALLAAPAGWALLAPAADAWSAGEPPEAAPLLAEDALDAGRVALWREFQQGQVAGVPPGGSAAAREHVERHLLAPLRGIEARRPDLLPYLRWVEGQLRISLGDVEQAERCYREALAVMPGCREAAFELHVKLLARAFAEGLPSEPSDYDAASSRLAAELRAAQGPYAREGLSLARGLLLYKRGDFQEAVAHLEPLARRYPHDAEATFNLERARRAPVDWAQEQLLRKGEDARGDQPRVRLTTTRGDVVLELFEDDAPNTVRNFVWLCEHGFYDGTAFHRNVPFFGLQGGDPFTKEGADPRWAGVGGPGYALATEPGTKERRRGAWRGTVLMASHDRDGEGSQFFLVTGTARHLDGQVSVFGRIVEGQGVVDALVEGDRLVSTAVVRRRPGTVYRPTSLSGEPAPAPRPSPPGSAPAR